MLKINTVPILLGAVVLLTLSTADGYQRNKRQAPNINVHEIPKTSFSCSDKRVGEYYADPESHCQVYHVCIPGMHNKLSLISFVCPNGTIFSQATKVCTPYDRVDCRLTAKFVSDSDYDYDNYVPPVPQAPRPPPPSRSRNDEGASRSRNEEGSSRSRNDEGSSRSRNDEGSSRSRNDEGSSRNRNTPAPPPTQAPTQPPRNNRFRSNQFRSNPAPTTAAPARTTAAAPARAAPARPAPPAFRPPVPAARPTPRTVVSTSTASYNYEYEYEYDYEDEAPGEQAGGRSKRSAAVGFSCEGKMPGGAYADVESGCEMFHICVLLGKAKILDYKVQCANGTAFDQETGSCREKDEFVCENAQQFFQFEKQNQPKSSKKPVISKKQYYKSKKSESKE